MIEGKTVIQLEVSEEEKSKLEQLATLQEKSVHEWLLTVVKQTTSSMKFLNKEQILGRNLRFLRDLKGYSRIEMATKLDLTVGPNDVYNWESGKTAPTVNNMQKIEDYYTVTGQDLCEANFKYGYNPVEKRVSVVEESTAIPDEEENLVGKNINYLRESSGLTKRGLSRQANGLFSDSAVSYWESGRNVPEKKNLIALANIFAVEVAELTTINLKEAELKTKKRRKKKREWISKPSTLSNNLLFLREELGLTRNEIVELSGSSFSYQTLYKWEVGQSVPTEDSMKKLTAVYGIPAKELMKRNFQTTYEKKSIDSHKEPTVEIVQPKAVDEDKQKKETFADNIRYLREAFSLKTSEFAEMLPFAASPKDIFSWEKGETMPKLEELEAISNFFNIPLKELFTIKLKEQTIED